MKILLRDEYKNDYTTRLAGERLRKQILEESGTVILDFTGITIASVSFFDEAIAKLFLEGFTQVEINKKVQLKDINHRDLDLLRNICKERGFEFLK